MAPLAYGTLIFDLDGTIIDSSPGLAAALRPAFAALGLPAPSEELIHCFIGPPLTYSFSHFCHLSTEEALRGIAIFREWYAKEAKLQCCAYEGIAELLQDLRADGKRLFLATNKPEIYAAEILRHLKLFSLFDGVYGADVSESGEKWEVIARIQTQNAGVDRERAVMIGDRRYDVEGAARCGLDTIGILYGFGERPELEAAGAKYIAATIRDLGALLLSRSD